MNIQPFCARFLFACLIFVLPAAAQFRIENWSIEQGLPYKTVTSVLQTRDGYLWASTADGLARFDGVKFTVFNTANTPELPTNTLGSLIETADGSLWITTDKRGLIRYRNGVFESFTTADGLPSNWIFSFHYFSSENLLRVATDKGLAHFDGKKFIRQDLPESFVERPTFLDNTGAVWQRFGNELRRVDSSQTETLFIPEFFSRSKFSLLYRDRSGSCWLALDDVVNGYIIRFQGDKTEVLSVQDGLPSGIISAVFEDSRGALWFGSKTEGGLSVYKNGKFERLTKAEGLSSNGFRGFVEDREGGVWAATADGGLMRFSEPVITSYSSAEGLSGKGVYPLFEDRDGTIWIGDWGSAKGLGRYKDGKFDAVRATSLYTSIFEDRSGALWVGSYNLIGRIENGKYSEEFSLPEKATSAIAEDHVGRLWLGSGDGLRRMKSPHRTNPNPLILIPNRDDLFDHFTIAEGLPADDVKVLHFDRSGTLWIGTTGGLAKLENETLTAYTEKDGLSGNHIRSIYEDADGALWFGTYDNGLTRLKNGRLTAIRVKDGLFDQGVFQILEDDFGRFWISSNRGIYRVNRQDLNDFADGKINYVTSVAYGLKDGMADAECNGGTSPAGFKSKRDGSLWFPTQKGVVAINPAALPVNGEPPNVIVESCLIDQSEVPCAEIEILPENDSLEIRYTGLSFTKPEQIRFRYKLEGLNPHWIDAGTRRRAFFTHLPPGEYVFRVSAVNADGVWNEAGAHLKIAVKPPFYRTFWFLAVCAVLVIALIAGGVNLHIQNLKKRYAAQEEFSRKLLESQENERQRIAAELHDSLGQDLLIIKNWALIGLRKGADPKTQFDEISQTASAAIEEVREIAYNLRPYHLDELGLTKAVESMLERVSEASAIEFRWEIDRIDDFFPADVAINFYRIVQECVNNIVKHSGAGRAFVKIERSGAQLQFTIRDDGKGFDTGGLALKRASQSGFGLAGISERARIIGGKLTIRSAPAQGTTIEISFV